MKNKELIKMLTQDILYKLDLMIELDPENTGMIEWCQIADSSMRDLLKELRK